MLSQQSSQAAIDHFETQAATILSAHDFFSPKNPVLLARAPGRLDVMGGNVDYTGGHVLQELLQEAVWIASQPRADGIIRVLNPSATRFGWANQFEYQLDVLRDAKTVQDLCNRTDGTFWGRYVLGSIHFLLQEAFVQRRSKVVAGVDLFIQSDLPPNKGVSSSAAITIATLKAVAAAWQIELAGIELATAGQWVENVIAGAACGIMDQAAIVLGRRDHLLPLLCQPCIPSPALALPPGICIWGIDSMVPRSTTDSSYEVARAAAFMGYRMICQREGLDIVPDTSSGISRWTDGRWSGHLSNLSPSEFRSCYERWLPEQLSGGEFLAHYQQHADFFTKVETGLDYPVRSAVRYAVEENLRVQMVSQLLQRAAMHASEDNLRLIGELFYQSHHSYTDCGLGSDACDQLVNYVRQSSLPGAKMTGGGAGGVVAVLGRTQDRDKCLRIAEEYSSGKPARPHIFEGSTEGVDAFGVRILQPSKFK